MNAIIKEFRQKRHGYRAINRNLQVDVMIFADDLVLLAASEDDLQHSLYNFKLVAEKYSMEIFTGKIKIMAICGKEPVPSKICLTFIGRAVQRLYQRMYFSLAERYNVCTAAAYLC
jgi:hypothetical protein